MDLTMEFIVRSIPILRLTSTLEGIVYRIQTVAGHSYCTYDLFKVAINAQIVTPSGIVVYKGLTRLYQLQISTV